MEIDVRGGPRRSRASRGSASVENPGKTGPKISSQTAFGCPVFWGPGCPGGPTKPTKGLPASPKGVWEGLRGPTGPARTSNIVARQPIQNPLMIYFSTGYLKAVWLEIFGPVFLEISAETDPRDPLDRRGPPRTSKCTGNQPRRPILMPFRGTKKSRQTAFTFRYPV